MKRKPKVGEKLRLYALTQKSRMGFSIEVECKDAFDANDALSRSFRMPAEKCDVLVKLHDGHEVWVTRADVEPVK